MRNIIHSKISFHLAAFALPFLLIATSMHFSPVFGQDIGNGFRPPQEIDGSKGGPSEKDKEGTLSAQGNNATNTPAANANPANQFELLFREMSNLIPGDVLSKPEVKKVVEDAITAFQLKDGNKVIQILSAYREKNVDFPPTQLLLAAMSFASEDAKTGRVLLERAAAANPDNPATYSAFARLAINEGRLTDAQALLEKIERLIPASDLSADAKAHYQRLSLDAMTDVAIRQQRFEDARKYLEKQRAENPNNPKVLMVSAELEFKEQNIDKAIEYLGKLRAVQPGTRVPEAVVGMWFDRVGNNEAAEKWATASAEKYPDDAQVQLEYANWAISRNKLPIASEAIRKAESKAGESILSKNLKARIAFSRESYAVAEAHYAALMAQKSFDASNMYALCLIEGGDAEKMAKAKQIAVQNFRALPNNLVAQATMGYTHLRQGDIEQAKSVLARAAQSRGSSPEIDYFLAALLAEMGNKAEARKTLEGALKFDGFFLYRSPAEKLLAKLDTGDLPAPEKK